MPTYANRIIKEIFPELKENEDEEIRKELIEFVDINTLSVDERHDRWIAWLEKQGTPAKLSEEEQNRYAKVVLTSCAESFIKYLDAHKYEGKMCVSNGECEDIENAFHNAMWDRLHRYYCKYIEKQGEQKPAVTDFNAKDWYVSKVDGKIHDMTYNPADKVEQKFKIGDWITDGEAIFHVIDYIEHVYQLVTQSGTSFHFSDVNVENKYHLWTIADAKDGDVLCDITNKNVLIFNEISDGWVKCLCSVHLEDSCCLNCTELYGREEQCSFAPATKEQHDLLFTKMKEAGYEWDAEKKELKKIHVIDDGKAEMDYCFTKMMAEEKVSPAWSEEDENYLQSAENACEYQYGKNTSTILWLKHLKDRIGG